MPQVLIRQAGGFYCIVDNDLALVCYGDCSVGNPALVGLAFRTGSKWRCLRLGLVDVGIEPNRAAAVDRIIADHERAHVVTLDDKTKAALPLCMAVAAMLLTGCASTIPEPPAKPAITSFSANHVTITSPDWPGPMAHSYCRLHGKTEVLISRNESGSFHFACLVMQEGDGEDLSGFGA